jgi:hypothetical protein
LPHEAEELGEWLFDRWMEKEKFLETIKEDWVDKIL